MPRDWKLSKRNLEWALTNDEGNHESESAPSRTTRRAAWDATRLSADLSTGIRGEVRFDEGSRGLYATDGSNYRQAPIGVVFPLDGDDVVNAIEICRRHQAPILARGGGTSLAGQCCNTAVVFDFSRHMNRVLTLDPVRRLATVLPGTILDDLRRRAEAYHLTFGPDPATHTHCTLGGMIGNDSCGIHAQMAGRTADNVHELEIVTYDGLRTRVGPTHEMELERIIREGGRKGEIYTRLKKLRDAYAPLIRSRYPKIPRRVSGYNLDELLPENGFNVARALVGSEGTLVTVLEASLRLVQSPAHRTLVALGYEDVFEAGDHIPEILDFKPIGLEGLDDRLVSHTISKGLHPDARKLLPEGNGWLLVEFGGETRAEAEQNAYWMLRRILRKSSAPRAKVYSFPEDAARVLEIRESGLGATARVPGQKDTWPGWEDSAVSPERIGDYLRDLRRLFVKHGYECALYGHFGQGCVHVRIDFDLLTADGIRKYRAFMNEATDLVISYGGSLSGEHGDGQSRAEFLGKMYGHELIRAFREFKSIWDPEWKMNPGKVVDPFHMDENLRLGTGYAPPRVTTNFKFPEDNGSFPYATLRCVGVGKCRRLEGGTMCPSFMATREEKDSTRGRAHLLFEMFQGEILRDGWSSEAVKDALNLCLSCKGCKKDCPVNVDMATYKSEFLSHYYESRPRPPAAYAFGLIDVWASLASSVPDLANFISQAPGLNRLAKGLIGIAPERKIPPFAARTFKDWFRSRGLSSVKGPRVLLWADTFNNYFHPEVAISAVEVLEGVGFHVTVPRQNLCCGRPLYDYGMLDRAKAYLRRILIALREEIRAGVPIVVLEPSCLSVFKDELNGLFPSDQDGHRLREQSHLLAEFIGKYAPDFEFSRLDRSAIVHGHCHQKALLGMKSEEDLLSRIGLKFRVPDSGCCGMAGGFGFEKEAGRYEVSKKAGERVLLPAVRHADPDTLIITNGFSCRTQILQDTNRRVLHSAEVLRMALGQEKTR